MKVVDKSQYLCKHCGEKDPAKFYQNRGKRTCAKCTSDLQNKRNKEKRQIQSIKIITHSPEEEYPDGEVIVSTPKTPVEIDERILNYIDEMMNIQLKAVGEFFVRREKYQDLVERNKDLEAKVVDLEEQIGEMKTKMDSISIRSDESTKKIEESVSRISIIETSLNKLIESYNGLLEEFKKADEYIHKLRSRLLLVFRSLGLEW